MNQQQISDGRHEDDAVLSDFLASLMDYTPTIPDELVEHYLAKSGFQCPDVRFGNLQDMSHAYYTLLYKEMETTLMGMYSVYTRARRLSRSTLNLRGRLRLVTYLLISRIRLVAVATQKFVADVATDALQQCKARTAGIVKDKRDKQPKDKRLVLTMDDLSKALREYGVNVKHQEYFADSTMAGMDPASRDE